MEATQDIHLPREQRLLVAAVQTLIGAHQGRDDDEHPLPPGPWDPVVRSALTTLLRRGPSPEPWSAGHGLLDEVALNPQPLPPRPAFLVAMVRSMATRAELLGELSAATTQAGEEGAAIVGGYVRRFVDDYCGNGFRIRWPGPGPRPHWFTGELDAVDLVVMGAQMHVEAARAPTASLRAGFAAGGARMTQVGLSRMR